MLRCGYCDGLGYVLWLGMPGPMPCRFCGGAGKIPANRRAAAQRAGDRRRAEPLLFLAVVALCCLAGVAVGVLF